MIVIRNACVGEAMHVGRNLREEDGNEVLAATGSQDLESAVVKSYDVSTICHSIYRKGDLYPLAIFGAADDPTTEGLGVVWMLCTDEALKVSKHLIRAAPEWLNRMGERYPEGLHNIADRRNYHHVRWCRLSGFEELGSVNVNGHEFIHIYRPSHV